MVVEIAGVENFPFIRMPLFNPANQSERTKGIKTQGLVGSDHIRILLFENMDQFIKILFASGTGCAD